MRSREVALVALAGWALADSPLIAQGLEAPYLLPASEKVASRDVASFASRLTISAMAGALWIDDGGLGFTFESSGGPRYEGRSDLAPLVGAVVGFDVVPIFSIEAHYARASASIGMDAWLGDTPLPEPVLEEDEVVVDLYALRGRLSFPSGSPLRASAVLGRGTINVDVDIAILEDGERFGPSGSTAREPMWEFGGGLEWRSGARWALRAEVIDYVQRCSGETHSEINICGRDGSIDSLHHPALTGAATLRF